MKSKVKLSIFSTILTYGVIILLLACIFLSWQKEKAWIGIVILAVMAGSAIFYYPRSIEATDSSVTIHRQCGKTSFAYSDIEAVERCYPSAGGLRLCGSGGFFGYWGYFTDIMIGNYFGYYGDRTQCFLVRLKDGKQYVVSCEHPDDMVKTICLHFNESKNKS